MPTLSVSMFTSFSQCFTFRLTRRTTNVIRVFDPSFRSVAQAWRSVPKTARDSHFFASLDFADGQDVFRKVCLYDAATLTEPPLNFISLVLTLPQC